MKLCCVCLKPIPIEAGFTLPPYLLCQCRESHATITVTLHTSTGTTINPDAALFSNFGKQPATLSEWHPDGVPGVFYDAFTDEDLQP
jgi:hypothetical protein